MNLTINNKKSLAKILDLGYLEIDFGKKIKEIFVKKSINILFVIELNFENKIPHFTSE